MSRRTPKAQRCPRCRMHRALCLCAEVPTVRTRTRVVLVLHQLEERKPTNTGRLAVLSLPNSIVVAQGWIPPAAAHGRAIVTAPPYPWQDPPGPCVLLFPDESARPIEEWRGTPDLTLIALDATWSQAARARRRFPGLMDLPSAFVPAGPPLYALRNDPRPGRVGTMEALLRALGALEGQDVQVPLERLLRLAADRTWSTRGRGRPHDMDGARAQRALELDAGAGPSRGESCGDGSSHRSA